MSALLARDRPTETRRGTIALAIKRITAPDHRAAEAAVEAAAPFASRAAYVRYLGKLAAFYAAMEPPLFARLDAILTDASERRKVPAIAADLRFLGVPRAAEAKTSGLVLPRLRTDADALGVGYVLEGKTLGSRFLLEEAKLRLDADAETGAGFLAGYGARTGAMWRSYLDALGGYVRTNGQRTAILRAARATFVSFTTWIERG